MPSSISHGLVAVAVGGAMLPQPTARRCWVAGVLCAILLDLDAIGRPFGRGDVTFLGGHRAITHSLAFAVLLGAVVAWTTFRDPRWDQQRVRIAGFLITATALHGVLDAFASYGDGVTLLWPFSTERYSSPWQPLKGPNEIWWIWVPVVSVLMLLKRLKQSRKNERSLKTSTGTVLL